jgi:hypothetical protein
MPLGHQVSLPQMYYPLKHFSRPYLVMLEPTCNNSISTLIMSLYASYVRLLHSCFVENLLTWILEDEPLISEVVLS